MDSNTPEGIGGDGDLSIDEAVKAYAAGSTESVSNDHEEEEQEAEALEADNSVDEEDGDQQADDDASEEDPEDDAEPIADDRRKVKLDDGTVITVGELKRGNLREADYTRKTQAHAAEVEAFEAHREQISQFEQQLAAARDLNIRILESRMPQRPSLDLLSSDPLGYIHAKEAYDSQLAEYQQLQAEASQYREQQARNAALERQERLAREMHMLHSKAPEFADASKRDAIAREMMPIAAEFGFSQQEVGNIDDHRLLLALRELARLKKASSGALKTIAKKVEARPPVQTGAKRASPGAQQARAADAAMNRLKQTGSLQDGVKAYLATRKG